MAVVPVSVGYLADSITIIIRSSLHSLQSLQSWSTLRDVCRALRLHLDALAFAAVTAVNEGTASPLLLAQIFWSGVAVGQMGVLRARDFLAQLGSHFLDIAHEAQGCTTAAVRDGRVWLQGTAAMLKGVWVPGDDNLLVCDGPTASSPLVYHTLPLRPPVSVSEHRALCWHRLAICRLTICVTINQLASSSALVAPLGRFQRALIDRLPVRMACTRADNTHTPTPQPHTPHARTHIHTPREQPQDSGRLIPIPTRDHLAFGHLLDSYIKLCHLTVTRPFSPPYAKRRRLILHHFREI